MIMNILKAIEARDALVIAQKVLQRMTAVFRYAVQIGSAPHNPAAEMKGVIKKRAVQHYHMITVEELPAFLRALIGADLHVTTRLALEFAILTAARTGEVRGATWDEIDLEKRLWTVPGERMKMKIVHTVPLSRQAVEILARMKSLCGGEGIVFPGSRATIKKPLSENTLLYAMYRMGYHNRATVHGFRAAFSTIANEAGYNPDAIERQLAHREKNQVRAAYHRSEYMTERVEMMQWWADHLEVLKNSAM
jgi:integrase